MTPTTHPRGRRLAAAALLGAGLALAGCARERYRAEDVRERNPMSPGGLDGRSFFEDGAAGFAGKEGYTGAGGGRYGLGETVSHDAGEERDHKPEHERRNENENE